MQSSELTQLTAGTPVIYAGNRVTQVPAEIADRFRPGDRIVVVQETGDLLLIPADAHDIAAASVDRAATAFSAMSTVSDAQITTFYDQFASLLGDEDVWATIANANAKDVENAKARGRSTTRLAANEKMRRSMIAGLREWRDMTPVRGRLIERIQHEGWSVEQVMAPLGVIAFVFEGRPNVFADATGVLRGGNAVVFRIGSDALGTARAIVDAALRPAIERSGLPEGSVVLLDSADHAAGWALFSNSRVSLAVARGSGRAVEQLGSVARQSGIPVSLHGTGGAWLVADESAIPAKLRAAIVHSLDRKVCNTLNVCCVPRGRADLIFTLQEALSAAADVSDRGIKVHVVDGDNDAVPSEWFSRTVKVRRAAGEFDEPMAEPISVEELGREWEWEETPELTVKLVDNVDHAVALFNRYSPQFVATLISEDPHLQRHFYETVNAPFVGNGFTRWPDGQYALNRPELGLSNWQFGRLFARGAILSGDGIYTIRARATQTVPDVHR
jgi:glutamate-5-semialdehyde dehydrogenase